MENVLTLIAGPAAALDAGLAGTVRQALDRLGADTAAAGWLSPGRACDIPFALLAPEQAEAAARRSLGGHAVDIVAQPAANRRKRLLVADMDSTVIAVETVDELAERAGLRAQVSAVTERAMRGEIEFAQALRERVALLRGLPALALAETAARLEPVPGARRLVATMKKAGAYTVLVSGGFGAFTERVARLCGFDAHHGNAVVIRRGKLTGALVEPVLDAAAKQRILINVAGKRRIPLAEALAVGDGANDLGMIEAAGLGVAFRAKPIIAQRARARIQHGDLSALLYVQGFRDEEMVGE